MAKAKSFVETGLTPIDAAATSSSRMAIQARPTRDDRSREAMTTERMAMPTARKYQGTQSTGENFVLNWIGPRSIAGSVGRPIGFIPCVPFVTSGVLRMTSGISGKPTARFDLTYFSSWAKKGEPAHVTFGRDRRPELMSMPLILGSSVKVELRAL